MLTQLEDAYGAAILDHWRGKGGYEIVERDDGWIDYSEGPPAYFAEYDDWTLRQREAIGLARGRVLDIGCGAGWTVSQYVDDGSGVYIAILKRPPGSGL